MSDDFDFVITRKESARVAPDFVCGICAGEYVVDRWRGHNQLAKAPICASCAVRWGWQARIPGMTRGDHFAIVRLTAITTAIEWEAMNGRFSKRRFAAL